MAVKPGDFLLVNYTLKVKESGETVDTTFDSVAKDAHIHREDSTFGPKFIILGEGWLPKGLEESLVGLDPGTSKTVELTPEKGFGNRDPTKMRLVPLRRFKDKEYPTPGQQVEFDGRPAVVRAVGAGRVQVDYNHPLAGRTLVYDVSIDKVLDNENDKILNLISLRIPEVPKEKFELKKHQNDLTIEVPEEAFYLSGLQVAKKAVTSDLQKFFPDMDTVVFQEVFKRSEPKPELPSPTVKPPEASPAKEEKVEAEPEPAPKKPRAPAKKKEATPKKPSTSTSRKRPKMGSENQR
jgi:FKBP-type peptidyl-prolyl cis-trans isomerase SlyD